jgi:hypothetical protein
MREKRTAAVKAHITPAMREQLDLFVAERGNVISLSDYLFELIEERITHVQVTRQKIGRRIGRQ